LYGLAVPKLDLEREMKKTKIWRTLSDAGHNGYFVWEIIQSTEIPEESIRDRFIQTFDGHCILIMCDHFWTLEKALAYLNENQFEKYFDLEIIP
jgi:hypothetical protein